ncbi:hypothetical protein ARMSODRAFT_982375 [Armillaria solidipes]|uniref:Uncharacterized protein n=1 Tax=Armillaria solidipes TaxID=1076256 RepID=A0A2H3AUF8_9AGAR|nr:hypothetical protein ARMSODRAFT_982375 [Armillaria solidipes]
MSCHHTNWSTSVRPIVRVYRRRHVYERWVGEIMVQEIVKYECLVGAKTMCSVGPTRARSGRRLRGGVRKEEGHYHKWTRTVGVWMGDEWVAAAAAAHVGGGELGRIAGYNSPVLRMAVWVQRWSYSQRSGWDCQQTGDGERWTSRAAVGRSEWAVDLHVGFEQGRQQQGISGEDAILVGAPIVRVGIGVLIGPRDPDLLHAIPLTSSHPSCPLKPFVSQPRPSTNLPHSTPARASYLFSAYIVATVVVDLSEGLLALRTALLAQMATDIRHPCVFDAVICLFCWGSW